jgi:hypothetical protein
VNDDALVNIVIWAFLAVLAVCAIALLFHGPWGWFLDLALVWMIVDNHKTWKAHENELKLKRKREAYEERQRRRWHS